MSRLTEQEILTDDYTYRCSINKFEYGKGKQEILNKLGKLEDLEEQLGCPLEVVGRLLLHKERYIYIVEKSKLTDEDFMGKHKVVGVSEFGVCILTTNCICILKTEPKYYEWKDYKKTWWLREDKSE